MPKQVIELVATEALRPWARNARTHSKKQIRQTADSIRTFGFTNPVLIDAQNTILPGTGGSRPQGGLGVRNRTLRAPRNYTSHSDPPPGRHRD